MHRFLTRSLLLGLSLLTLGCLQPSINPLFAAKDTRFDAALVGKWACGEEKWTIEKDVDDAQKDRPYYKIDIAESGETVTLGARLGTIDGVDFITFWPDSAPQGQNVFYKSHIVQGYSFGRVLIDGEGVRFRLLADNWIEAAAKTKTLPAMLRLSEGGVLISSPAELQRFARANKENRQAFAEEVALVRDKPGATLSQARCYSVK